MIFQPAVSQDGSNTFQGNGTNGGRGKDTDASVHEADRPLIDCPHYTSYLAQLS